MVAGHISETRDQGGHDHGREEGPGDGDVASDIFMASERDPHGAGPAGWLIAY